MDNVGNTARIKSTFIEVAPSVVLTSITVSPSGSFLEAGGTQQFTATGNFSDGSTRALGTSDGLGWSVDHSTVASISPGGLVTGVAYGITRIRVNSGSLSADTDLLVYDPAPASFSTTGSMLTGRHMHTGTLLRNHKVLVTGGNNGGYVYLASAELYDPVSGTFEAAAPMNSPRGRAHAATLLLNGKVLVTGGNNGIMPVSSAELYDPVDGTFSDMDSMAVARGYHTSTLLPDGKVLIAGGSDETGASVAVAELYDPDTNTFSTTGAMNAGRHIHAAALLANGKVLITGGYSNGAPVSSAEIYDPATGKFSATGSMSSARAYPKTVPLWNGKVLVTGGYDGSTPVLSSELYDPSSGQFSVSGPMRTRRLGGHTATLLPNGKVLVAGGDEYGNNNALYSAEVYDPATGAFAPTALMSMGRIFHAAALLLPNGRVLVCGGYNGSASVASADLYNFGFGWPVSLESIKVSPSSATVELGGTQQFLATGKFSDGSSRALGVSDGLAWSVDHGTVSVISPDGLAIGTGYGKTRLTVSSGSLSSYAVLTVTHIPAAAKFAPTGSMSVGRHMHTATLLPNGKVLITGGNNGGYVYLSSAELYDPVAGAFTVTGSMSTPRGRAHASTLLANGKVLVTGGNNGSTPVSSAELYDPVSGTFSDTDSMLVARNYHTATLLPDGKVLIAGGSDETGASVAVAELYDPDTNTFSTTGAMNAGRHIHAAALLANGKVLLTGGYSSGAPVSSAEIYEPATGKFSATGSMSSAGAYPKTILLWNGKVLVTGGYDGNTPVLSSELYDPAFGQFSVSGPMSTRRLGGHTATLLPDGKVLVAGGDEYGNNNALYTAEVYDPAIGTFSPTASMSMGRIFHAAALLLPNGRVLVCGGYNGSASVSSAEVYDSGYSDITSPVISAMTVAPQAINPANNQAIVSYELSEPGNVTLDLLSGVEPHEKIESVYSGIFQPAGPQFLQWNGKTAANEALPDGEYVLRLMITDIAGNIGVPLAKTVLIDSSYPQIQAISAKPEKFNPSSGERARFVFSVSEESTLNITVKDGTGASVKDLVVNFISPAGALNFYWDGRDNSAQVVQPGVYQITVAAADRSNNQSEALGGNCEVLSPEYPSVTGLTETPDPFLPDSAVNEVNFTYHLTAAHAANVRLTISHPVLGVIKTMDLTQEQGDRSIPWDGLSDSGLPAPDGAYSEKVSITVDGNLASAQGAFSLLRHNTVSAQSSEPDPVLTVQYDDPAATVTITKDPPLTSDASAALQSQTQSGTVLASPIFDIVASQAFETQPVLRFKYDPAYDGESLALYKYSVSAGAWIPVSTSYVVDLVNNEIIITLNPDVFMGSLFALMQAPKGAGDSSLPVSTISAGKPSFEAFGLKVITPHTPIEVSARDDGEGASGVDKIFCAVDSETFAEYIDPYTVAAQGEHSIKCRAQDKAGNMETAKELRLVVMPLEDEAVESAEGLTVSGTAEVVGTVRANAVLTLNGNARITGDTTASDVILKGKAAVTGLVAKTANTLLAEPIALGPLALAAAAANSNDLVPEQYLQNGSLIISTKVRLELPAGTYYFKGIALSGGASVTLKGNADIMVEGPVNVTDSSALNAEGPASRLKLFVNSEQPVTLSGGGKAAAYVYAPRSALKLSGNVLAGGHWFARSVELSGTGNILQSGDNLPRTSSRFKTSELGSLADATFRLGEVYVFPNPAKGGEVPTFHVETGIADSVKITIYTISGRPAHEYTLTGLPAELDDGNGLSYAYEYAWRGHIPSGVYLYYMEAQKAGQKLRKTGKFAVVR
jgi:flagellar hook assembly protein FlgD